MNSLSYDWVSKEDIWRMQLSDFSGRVLLNVGVGEHVVSFSGKLKGRLPEVKIASDFLEINSYKIGIKQKEVPCLLNFSLPLSWLGKISKWEQKSNFARMKLSTEWRDVSIEFYGIDKIELSKICTNIKWSYYWGLSRKSLRICNSYGRKKHATIEGLDNFFLKWESDEKTNS